MQKEWRMKKMVDKTKKSLPCYVCGKLVKRNPVVLLTGRLVRHTMCEPGSTRWMKSKVGKRSPLRKYFKSAQEAIELLEKKRLAKSL